MNPLAAASVHSFKGYAVPDGGPQQSLPFTAAEIERVAKQPGVYALGYLDDENRFVVKSLGRAEEDLRDELSVRLFLLMGADLIAGPEENLASRYARFAFEYAETAEEAFEKECLEYHELWESGNWMEQMDDRRHPTKEPDKDGRRAFCPIWQCAWNY